MNQYLWCTILLLPFGLVIVWSNYCDDFGCCSTNECNICASSCYDYCSTETCEKSCVKKCILNTTINICDGPICCRNQGCTHCVEICASDCPTQQCKTSCIYNCIQGVSSHCSESGCCTTAKCDNCAQNCVTKCQTQLCTHECVENCVQGINQVCTGMTCSLCSETGCCKTTYCNVCAKSCISQCSTPQCKDICINKCLQNTPQYCQGPYCNVCSGGTCCNTRHCNDCAYTCTTLCNTPECRNSCLQKCLRTTPSCVGPYCNLCVGNKCCTSPNCNTCVNYCYNQNTPSSCTNSCVKKCVETEPTKIVIPLPESECPETQTETITPLATTPPCVGPHCKLCVGNKCCTSQNCNSCVNYCYNQNTSSSCTNSCVKTCVETEPTKIVTPLPESECPETQTETITPLSTTPPCGGPHCKLCVGNKCCTSQNCNSCVNYCYNQNTSSNCTNSCVKTCVETEPTKIVIPPPGSGCPETQTETITPLVTVAPVTPLTNVNVKNDTVNITTHVIVHNIVNNTNIIKIPVKINSTNINHINLKKSRKPKSPKKCCYVVHPKECFSVARNISDFEDIQDENNTVTEIKCIRRRHRECSSICTSSVVLLQEIPFTQFMPYPLPIYQQPCLEINQYPWQYCGNYQKHDCGPCYDCEENYEPQQCSLQTNCSLACRNSLFTQ